MNALPMIVITPVFVQVPLPIGFVDEHGRPVQVVDQVRDFHRDARALGTFPAASAPATEYGRKCAAEAVRLCKALAYKRASGRHG